MDSLYRSIIALLIFLLFAIGDLPAASKVFPGILHWAAHFAVFALIAFTCGMGWRKTPAAHIALVVAGIGILHEVSEIVFHSHGFEFMDAAVNVAGALTGVAVMGWLGLRQN